MLIIWMTIWQIVLLLLETVARFYFAFITAWLGQTVVRDLRVDVYKKVLGLNLSQFDKTPIGTLTTRTINDIEAINDIFSDGLIPIIADLLSILSVLLFMFWTDWRLTLVCLAPFPLADPGDLAVQGDGQQVLYPGAECGRGAECLCAGAYHGYADRAGFCRGETGGQEIRQDQPGASQREYQRHFRLLDLFPGRRDHPRGQHRVAGLVGRHAA